MTTLSKHQAVMKNVWEIHKKEKEQNKFLNNLSLVEKAFYLKHVSPQKYWPWNKFAQQMIWQMHRNSPKAGKEPHTVWINAPAYYLTKELAEAFINTPVKTLKLEQKPNLINKHFIIFQPIDVNQTNYTLVSVNESNESVLVQFTAKYKTQHKKTHKHYGRFAYKQRKIYFRWNQFKGNFHYSDNLGKYWRQLTEDQLNIVVNMILFMNQQPDITVEEYTPSNVIPLDPQPERRILFKPRAITWIGKNFTERVIKTKKQSEELIVKRVGQPMRSHWRRGHWHTILQGPKRKQRKMKWFQPVFVIGRRIF